MKNPSTMILAKLIVLFLPGVGFAQTAYEQQILDNQQQLLSIQQQQLNIIQQEQFERDSARRQAKNRETQELWVDYINTDRETRAKQKEIDRLTIANCERVARMSEKERAYYSREARKIDPNGEAKCPSER